MTGRQRRRGRAAWLGVGIGLLAVVAVVLVVAAFQLNRVRSATTDQSPSAVGESPGPSPSTAAPDSPAPTATPTVPALSRIADAQILRMLDSQYGYRAVRSSCGASGATIQRTTDGGETWTPMDLGAPGPQVVVAINVVDADQADAVVRRAGDCGTSVVASFTGGEFWSEFPERLTEQVYADPISSTTIRLRAQTIMAPCSGVVDVWSVPSGVVALCPNQVVRYSSDTAGWVTVTTGDVLAAAADVSTGNGLVAVAGSDGCEGVLIEAFEDSSALEARACLSDTLVGDRATLAVAGQNAWIWSGASILKSDDGGVTWAQVG